VHEDNPDAPKLKLEYRAADSPSWTPIPLTPGPQGTVKVHVTTSAALEVRLQFKDLANNAASVEAQVPAIVAAAAYNAPAANPRAQDDPLPGIPVPPVAPAGTPLPPSAMAHFSLPGQDIQTMGGVAAMPQVSPPDTKMAAIASTADTSQGSPVPVQIPNQASPRGMPPVQIVNEPEIVLEYEVSKVGPSGLGKIEVWLTRDNGANWVRFAEDPDANQATIGEQYKRTLLLPGEGVYGISLVVKSKAGIGKAGPRSGDVPEMLVEVDNTPPEAQLYQLIPDPQRRDMVILRWVAKDRNLTPTPITLEWAERPIGPWQIIGANLPNTGRFPWTLPKSLPSHVYLKLMVRDMAGNEAVAVTPVPELVDLSEPEGRLLRVTPAGKK
jgi:hypothetical protein